MRIYREQLPVGQGCFATGTISLGGLESSGKFEYVYDCGSRNPEPIKEAVIGYRERGAQIDALFVSHLDSDHVSGLDLLLSANTVDSVYIPYVDNVTPILEIIEAHEDGDLSGSLIQAHLAPETWFGQRGVRRIVRVRGDGEGIPDGPDLPPNPTALRSEGHPWIKFKESREPKLIHKAKSRTGASEICEISLGTSILLHSGSGFLDWVLIPYVHAAPVERRLAFFRALRKALGMKREQLTADRLARALRSTLERESIKRCYDQIINAGGKRMHNRLSMSLYSGPSGKVRDAEWERALVTGHGRRPRHQWRKKVNAVGWIGTGDATFRVEKVLERWQQFFSPMAEQISTLLLPHHGSKHNFHSNLLTLPNLDLCVAAADLQSRGYHHPSASVIAEIGRHGASLWHVSSAPASYLLEVVDSM